MELLLSKFTTAAQRYGFPKRFAQLGRISVATVAVLGSLIANLLRLLAASAETSDDGGATANAVRGGALNFRTGKFDDGTDPSGWYEDD